MLKTLLQHDARKKKRVVFDEMLKAFVENLGQNVPMRI